MDLLDGLNKEQKAAVSHEDGPLLIVAGAGTGKTTVITRKIAYLISQGLKPEEILALTFTEKAAREMEDRVESLLDFGYYDFWISTFHSFCDRVLKNYGLEIGLPTNYRLLDQTGAWILIKKNFSQFSFLKEYRPLGNPTKFIHALIAHFNTCKNEGIYPENYLEYADSIKKDLTLNNDLEFLKINEVANAYHAYQRLLLENNALDFGDLINYTLKLFEKRPRVLEMFREQFKYVMVDEFQDTNWVQYELVQKLAAPKNNLVVVGDDDQSIFSFQGASFNNVLRFKSDYPNAKEVILVENYRSSQEILDLAYSFIQHNNPNRLEHQLSEEQKIKKEAKGKGIDLKNFKCINKKLKSNTKSDGHVELLSFETFDDEVVGVINKIWEIKEIDAEAKFSDFCILARTNESANYFARGLERASIPYHFLSSKGLYSDPIILDIIAYFKIVLDFYDSPSFYRVLRSLPLGLKPEEVAKISRFAEEKTLPIFEVLQNSSLLKKLSPEASQKIAHLIETIKNHFEASKESNASDIFVRMINDLKYDKALSDPSEENLKRWEIIYQLFQKIKDFENSSCDGKLIAFMENLQMELDAGEEGGFNNQLDESDSVKIMTVHSAKGLEFDYVFVVSMVQRKFPSDRKSASIEMPSDLIREVLPEGDFHLQEERRLFYVALTRARKGLFLTWAEDYGGRQLKKPSRFLIESGLIKKEDLKEKKSRSNGFSFSKFNGFKKDSNEICRLDYNGYMPNHFSFSQLAAFQKCPLQYKYAHIFKIPKKGKPSLSFGKSIHNTLYRFVKKNTELIQSEQISLFGKVEEEREKSDLSLKDLLEIYDQEWIDAWFDSVEHKAEFKKKGEAILKNFYNDFLKRHFSIQYIGTEPALEKNFNLKLNGDAFVGTIDRIDKIGENEVEIIDYKTGVPKKSLSADDKLQLLIYHLATVKLFKLNPTKLTYCYVEENEYRSFEPKESDLKKTEDKILEIISKIKRSNFKPSASWHCQYCDYKDICPHRKF